MTLGLIQPLTEMSTRDLARGKRRPAHKADNLTAICELLVQKMREPRRFTNLWVSTACYRDSFTFYCIVREQVPRAVILNWLIIGLDLNFRINVKHKDFLV
jgi:hypothetical protein